MVALSAAPSRLSGRLGIWVQSGLHIRDWFRKKQNRGWLMIPGTGPAVWGFMCFTVQSQWMTWTEGMLSYKNITEFLPHLSSWILRYYQRSFFPFKRDVKYLHFTLCICVCRVCVCVCAQHVCSAHGVLKRSSDLLELEVSWLWAPMWVLGTEPGSSARAVGAFTCRAISPAPEPCHFVLGIQTSTGIVSLVFCTQLFESLRMLRAFCLSVYVTVNGAWSVTLSLILVHSIH